MPSGTSSSERSSSLTGQLYGGRQELHGTITEWHSCKPADLERHRYLRMVLEDLAVWSSTDIHFAPMLGEGLTSLTLTGLSYRKAGITLSVSGSGSEIGSFTVNGIPRSQPFLSTSEEGDLL
mgnify:CR=1 FL=1